MLSAPRPEVIIKNEDSGSSDVAASEELIKPTAYEIESKASAAAWATMFNSILAMVTESSAMSSGMQCSSCRSTASY